MLHHKNPDKAKHYIDLLNAARCNDNWSEIPGLLRKVEKHAPQRLQIAAQAEYQEAVGSTVSRQTLPRLTSALQESAAYPEDIFQARICLASVYWTLDDPALALQTIPENIREAYNKVTPGDPQEVGWTSICAIKGAYIRGDSQVKANKIDDALKTYQDTLSLIESTLRTGSSIPGYRLWAEKLLAQHCILSSRVIRITTHNGRDIGYTSATSAPFRIWADLWQSGSKNQTSGPTIRSARDRDILKRLVWRGYYDILSDILQNGTEYPTVAQRPSSSANEMSADNVKLSENARLQQVIELRRVEGIYEEILLREVSFPKANEAATEVESWADQVVTNWRIISSPRWLDEELGKGGKEAASRNVLAILYRAASRTFHSTRILRHLFTLHFALAEFTLAGKAFDTYIELVSKGKARVEKSGDDEIGLDDDATMLRCTAVGIRMLCCYGRRKQVERAQEIATILEGWLEKMHSPSQPILSADDNPVGFQYDQSGLNRHIPADALAAAHHSLGICRVHWARVTYETLSRPELQTKAIASFRTALRLVHCDTQSAEIHYALALTLAETRDIEAAIDSVKRAISFSNNRGEGLSQKHRLGSVGESEHQNRRLLFKAWHFWSFLLSARQDFATATASCYAANELYHELLERLGVSRWSQQLALSEQEFIIELKMSQLLLSEILDGPEEAVNSCGELLNVYRGFYSPGENTDVEAPIITFSSSKDEISPPQTANGTVQSARRSLLGRSKRVVSSLPRLGHHSSHIPPTGGASSGASRDTNIPSSLDGAVSERKYQPPQHLARQESKKLHKRRSRKSMVSEHRTRGESPQEPLPANGSEDLGPELPSQPANLKRSSLETSLDGSYSSKLPNGAASDVADNSSSNDKQGRSLPPTSDHTTNHKNQNLSPDYPKPPISGSWKPSPIAAHLNYPLPDPIYSSTQLKRRSLTLLARIWLLIAQLYRDAGMPIDAQGALSEAFLQAQSIEAVVAAIESSAEALSTPGWGNLKSVAEVWADVHAEKGALHVHLNDPKAASEEFEKALGWFPDHNAATVGLSNILLDYYHNNDRASQHAASSAQSPNPKPILANLSISEPSASATHQAGQPDTLKPEASPTLLSRLAARDRAYGLLSMLTKSGRGWDDSEAWFALARAHEQSGQIDKAKEALWWVVELEDSRPLRDWSCIGGF
ncbi:MAG: hypothetical protein Q9207_007366 [Kuettlingeria erythrocarpa]